MASRRPWRDSLRLALAGTCALALAAGCGDAPSRSGSKPRVVAAENVWGSIAAQLAGDRAEVRSVIVDPATDPHDYEPTASDARLMAGSQLAIVNGIGYDGWASRLLAADPSSTRDVIDVGRLLGLDTGDNPHQWYSPASVRRVVAAIAGALERLDPGHSAYYTAREHAFETRALARYDALIAEIRRRYSGVPVGYSESIFQPLGQALGLRLLTPASFANAVAEGSDVSARDVETVETQARKHEIAVWVLNSQNLTPEVRHVTDLARASGVRVVEVTETLSPARLDFEQWQVAQLERLLAALREGTGR